MKKIKKILIANRGEIAVRIHRSAKELNITTVAIFSDIDRCAPHVLLCDEAYPLNGMTIKETYLNIDKILEIARLAKVDAIHPGYGFLSEKSNFAKAIESAGIIFIGPRFETIELLGSKTGARALLKNENLPIVPGNVSPLLNIHEANTIAEAIGYPVLIKAVGGGGGKGMRKVENSTELRTSFEQAKNEAQHSFSDDRIYIEKYILNPKHIEVQIIADSYGNVVHLGERECSIQRRHQKIIEECPSPSIDDNLRVKIGEVAVDIAKASKFQNAGTVEFLMDSEKKFYFLEINTRIQVEHPVTELVYGIDIVKEQIRIAEGGKLSVIQENVKKIGHAIECRIYAEEYYNNFSPSTGTITHYQPSEGIGIRNDSGIRLGTDVTPFYDPLLAKLISHGQTRNEAISRMERALLEYKINGVTTTIPFCHSVLQHKEFINGTYTIKFLEDHYKNLPKELNGDELKVIGATYLEQKVIQHFPETIDSEKNTISLWKKVGRDG
jgi:acetyl-CoA carboxylase, biotin carboxylase subunit